MARKPKKETAATPTAPMAPALYLAAEGIIREADTDAPVVFVDSGYKAHDTLERMVDSYNALRGYTVDQIRRGEFKNGIHATGDHIQIGNGNVNR